MENDGYYDESKPLTADYEDEAGPGPSRHSLDSDSTTSVFLEHINGHEYPTGEKAQYTDKLTDTTHPESLDDTEELLGQGQHATKPVDRKTRRVLWVISLLCLLGWGAAAALFFVNGGYKHTSKTPHDPSATQYVGSKKKITLDQIQHGVWMARTHSIRWMAGPEGQDGLLLEAGSKKGGHLVVDDVRNQHSQVINDSKRILMVRPTFSFNGSTIWPVKIWPSPNLRSVLVMSDYQSNWRHSSTGLFWIFDVNTQKGEPLDPSAPSSRIQLAQWSPRNDAIVFVRDNNLYLRKLDAAKTILPITRDGNSELFYGVPDWVYEEEVIAGNSVTWFSEDGQYIAFFRTNESMVPSYPVQYYVSRPTGKQPIPGQESYPDLRQIKYPRPGAPNPIVNLLFYDVDQNNAFQVPIQGDFEDHDRIINEVVWAGTEGKVIVKETNRVSDVLKVIVIDVFRRQAQTVREQDVKNLDGGWFEVSQRTRFVPPDPKNGRGHAGYVDTTIFQGRDHLAYFSPLDNPEPIMLTTGDWEVVDAPSSVDLKNNWVYFVATKQSPIQRQVYRVKLDGTSLTQISNNQTEGYHSVSFSSGSGFALLDYSGPDIPWQKVISMPGSETRLEFVVEDNKPLQDLAAAHELPINIYSTITIDGFTFNTVERRPPHFSQKRKYPVLFYMYQGPGSQTVNKKFNVDFQAYVAATLGYIVVTVDGRGTGFMGRKTRCIVRGRIGWYESSDQIAAAKMWAAKPYVDKDRMAIWGWSYGGFMALKTLERDAGQTFKYGMAVAPVTDWRFYDSIYTERYMFTPQQNYLGYENTSIHDITSLGKNVRFLLMHGIADDNVHTQNTYSLLDKLDIIGVENYDMHLFPDSDHAIYFHNANSIIYDSKFLSLFLFSC